MFKQLIFITLASFALIQNAIAEPVNPALKAAVEKVKLDMKKNATSIAKLKIPPLRIRHRGFVYRRLHRVHKKNATTTLIKKQAKK